MTQAETFSAKWMGSAMFLLAVGLPAALFLRSGYRSVARHPLVKLVTETPEKIGRVRISKLEPVADRE